MADGRTTRRVAAGVAIVAAALTLGALGALVVRNTLAVVGALVALAVAAYAGWLALSRHGRTRLVAGSCSLLAVVAAAVILGAAGALNELLVAIAAFVVFAVAGPLALRDARTHEEKDGHRGASRREHAVVLINPRSGDGAAERAGLAAEAERRGIETIVLQPGDDLRELAERAAERAEVIGMAGGDGSQALVAGVAADHDVAFVCIPAGTRNHFALDLGVDREDVVGALDAFRWGTDRRVDLAQVNDRTFVNNVSLGVYAEIVQSQQYRGAKLATARAMLPDLLGPDAEPLPIHVFGPDGREYEHIRVVLVSNNPYRLDGVVGVGARQALDTGKLGILAIEIAGASDASALVSLDAVGQAKRYRGWHEWSADELDVGSDEPVKAGVDGEALVLEAPLRFRIRPGALRARVLPWAEHDVAARVQTRRVSAEVLGNLWDVASGSR